jgi:hypothetical protein
VVAGALVVEDGVLVAPDVDDVLRRHATEAARLQAD